MSDLFSGRFELRWSKSAGEPVYAATVLAEEATLQARLRERLSALLGVRVNVSVEPEVQAPPDPKLKTPPGAPRDPKAGLFSVVVTPAAGKLPSGNQGSLSRDALEEVRETVDKFVRESSPQVEVALLSFETGSDWNTRRDYGNASVPPLVPPMLDMDGPSSRAHLKLVLERVVYVLHRLAAEPAVLLDGRYHHSVRAALGDLDRRLESIGGWDAVVDPADSVALAQHGLTGPQWALKFQAFDQSFQESLDRMALLERKVQGMYQQLEDKEVEAFAAKVRKTSGGSAHSSSRIGGARHSAKALFERAEPILDSLGDVVKKGVPHADAVLGAVKELAGMVRGLVSN